MTANQNHQFVDFPQRVGEKLFDALLEDEHWETELRGFSTERNKLHVAVMIEPYLRACLEGKKTIESRFSRRRIPPYRQIVSGDVILLKRPGGPIVGVCAVSDAWFYELDPIAWNTIKTEYLPQIYADNEFLAVHENATYATLIRIQNARSIKPIDFAKRDMRGWVVLMPKRRPAISPTRRDEDTPGG